MSEEGFESAVVTNSGEVIRPYNSTLTISANVYKVTLRKLGVEIIM